MRIAILGTRGIPSAYGGFETFAEELATRLVGRGHQVWVYARPHAVREVVSEYRGVRLVHLPSIRHKYLETVTHTLVSALHLALELPRVDVALICNAANSAFAWIPRLRGVPAAVNVDGLERLRKKWNILGRAWYRVSERLSTWLPNAIVTDALAIQRYYQESYGASSTFIPYGAVPPRDRGTSVLEKVGLPPGNYVLYVSRMEPENNALLVVRAFERVQAEARLAMIGDAPYAAEYIRQVRATSDARIVFPGAIYGAGYDQLRAHARLYVHATEVGGTHPALIEAMAAGLPVLYLDTLENREVAGDAGVAFTNSAEDLARKMERLLRDPAERARLALAACDRVRRLYDWDAVTTAYERLFESLRSKG